MNTESTPTPQPATQNAAQTFLWSVRREIWENRSIYMAPIIVAGVYFLAYLVGMHRFLQKIGAAHVHAPYYLRDEILSPFEFASLLMMGTTIFVAIFYCLDALYGERRDRSILFWKSLPVSDLTTVLSKAAIPLVVLPVVTAIATLLLQSLMLIAGAAAASGNGLGARVFSSNVPLLSLFTRDFYHLITIHSLWYAPFFAWFILVSAWARRAPLLWAFLPIFVIGFIEKIAFNSTLFLRMLLVRFIGEAPPGSSMPGMPSSMSPVDPHVPFNFGDFLLTPGLWIGLAITAAFLLTAVRIRRYRDPI